MCKKLLALVLTAALALSLCLTPALAAPRTYPDAVGNWAASSITRWSNVGIVTGDNDGLVHPGQYLRRCELATILVRLLGLTQRAPANTFTDVPAGAWYADAILKCAAAGIMEGYDGRADPEEHITREQAITMIGRALGVKSKEGQSLTKYRDASSAFAYSKGYLSAFTAMGILNGVGDGTRVAPKEKIDRASAFALLDRAIGAYVTAPGVVEVKDANQFVVINVAATGDVTLTGKCAGVLVTTGNWAGVKFNGLSADTVKVDAPVKVQVTGSSKLGSMDLNAPASVEVSANCTVGSIDTKDATKDGVPPTVKDESAAASNKNTSSGGGGGGGGGGRPSRPSASPSVEPSASAEPSASPSAEPSTSPEPSDSPSPSQEPGGTYSIALDAETVKLQVGQSKTVTATVTPAGAELTYTVAPDTGVVAVELRGHVLTITARKAGTASVGVALTNGPSKSISVTVTAAGEPSTTPSTQPSATPSTTPSTQPSATPSTTPSTQPSATPSTTPSTQPSATPSTSPSTQPSTTPSADPSTSPEPSDHPSPSTEPGDVTVTLAIAGETEAVESVSLQGEGVTDANGAYTVKADTVVTVVVTLKAGVDGSAYQVSSDTVTFELSGSTFAGTVRITGETTITMTVISPLKVAKDDLRELMLQAREKGENTEVATAIADAEAVLYNETATLADVQRARDALRRAMEALNVE